MRLSLPRSRYTVAKVMMIAIGASLALRPRMWNFGQLSPLVNTPECQQRQVIHQVSPDPKLKAVNKVKRPEEAPNPGPKDPKPVQVEANNCEADEVIALLQH